MIHTHVVNILHCLANYKLDPDVSYEQLIKLTPFSIPCSTTKRGTHYHFVPSTGPPDQNRPKLVFLHALGGNSFNWLNLVPFFSDYEVYLLDLPSHGRSYNLTEAADFTEAYITWLAQAMADLDIAQPHLIGLSTGARIAAEYALAGHSISSLTLLGPALSPNVGLLYRSVYSLIRGPERQFFRNVGYKVLLQFIHNHDKYCRFALTIAFRDMIRDQAPRDYLGIRQTMQWLLEPNEIAVADWKSLTRKIPVTAVFGQQDVYCPSDLHTYLSDAGVNGIHVLNCSHLLPLDDPESTAAAILATINKNSG